MAEQSNRWVVVGWVSVLALAALALAARAYKLAAQSLWMDEGLSVLFARPELGQLLPRLVTDDIHPPFYIVALHFWMEVAGDGEFAVRYLSAIFGVLLVPVMYRLGTDLFARSDEDRGEARLTGVLAAVFVAASPFLVYFSQEARNYIVVTFWAALSTLALWRALSGGGRRWWATYAIASALVAYTHYYGTFVLLAQVVYLLLTWSQQRGRWRAWFLSVACAVGLFLPWVAGFWGQARNLWFNPDYWPGTIDLLTIALRTFASFSFGSARALGGGGEFLAVFGVLFAAGLVALLARGGVRTRRGELYLLIYLLVPLLVVYAISARYPKFVERYLIIISPAFYLVLARGLAAVYGLGRRWQHRWRAATIPAMAACVLGAVLVVGVSATETWRVYYGEEWVKDDHRGAIGFIDAHSQPGDVIILIRNTYHSFQYYYTGDLPWHGLDPGAANNVPDVADVAGRLTSVTQGRERVWLLLWQEEVVDPTRLVAGLLRRSGRQVPLPETYTGVRLELYELPQGVDFTGDPDNHLQVAYENGVSLTGFDLPVVRVRPGESFDLGLYWQAKRALAEEFGATVALKDDRGFVWANEGHRPSGHYLPPTRWPAGRTVRGDCPVAVPPGTPPGRYYLELNVHAAGSLQELSRVEESGQPIGTRLILAQVEVAPAGEGPPPALHELGLKAGLDAAFLRPSGEEAVRLLGRGELPVELAQGSSTPLSLYWEGGSPGPGDHEVSVDLVGVEMRRAIRAPLAQEYATSHWRAGERLRGQYHLLVPPNLPEGEYSVRLSVLPAGAEQALYGIGGEASIVLGSLRVTGIPRAMEPPPVAHRQDAVFGGLAWLYGFDLPGADEGVRRVQPGEEVDIRLVWQAVAATETAYTVFVHLADATGRPWAQHDGQPALGTRPTTGWLEGEFVQDARRLQVAEDVPPGRYQLLVGVYGPDGMRLMATAQDGRDLGNAVPLAGVAIEVAR